MTTLNQSTARFLAHALCSPRKIIKLQQGLKATLFIDGNGNLIMVKNTIH